MAASCDSQSEHDILKGSTVLPSCKPPLSLSYRLNTPREKGGGGGGGGKNGNDGTQTCRMLCLVTKPIPTAAAAEVHGRTTAAHARL